MQADPNEQNNLIRSAEHQGNVKEMEDRLYQMMAELGGMDVPMNAPRGKVQNKRLRERGAASAEFPDVHCGRRN